MPVRTEDQLARDVRHSENKALYDAASATPRLKAGAWDKAQALTDYPKR